MSQQSDALDQLLNTTPELANSPGIAAPLAMMPGDTQQQGQALAQYQTGQNLAQAYNDHASHVGGSSWLGKAMGFVSSVGSDLMHPVEQAGGQALHVLGAGLQEVQHQYRYIHDVWQRYGPARAMIDLLPAIGIEGTALFTDVITGGVASPLTTVAAEAATGMMARVTHKDSWDRTANGETYLDSSGGHVSIGRDIAGALAHIPGMSSQIEKHGGGWVSGTIDAIADLNLDPVALAGRVRGEAMAVEGAPGILGKVWGGMSVANVEQAASDIGPFSRYARFNRAVGDIAGMNREADIVAKYGEALGPIAPRLAEANTPGEVVDVFRSVANTNELKGGRLPTNSVLRAPFSKLYEAMADPTGNKVQKLVAHSVRLPEFFDPENMHFSGQSFKLDEKGLGNASEGVYRSLLMGMKPADARDAVQELYTTNDPVIRANFLKTSYMKMFDNLGIKELTTDAGEKIPLADASDELVRKKLFQKIEDLSGGDQVGRAGGPALAKDASGRNISGLRDPAGDIKNVPVHVGDIDESGNFIPHEDTPSWSFPDYQKARKEIAGLGRISKVTGGVNDWWYEHYTKTIFKPLALTTLGFAARVASGEILPQAFRGETIDLLKSRVATSMAKRGAVVGADESDSFFGALFKNSRSKVQTVLRNGADSTLGKAAEEHVQFAADLLHDNGGSIMAPENSAGHHYSGMVNDNLRWGNGIRQTVNDVPESLMGTVPGDFTGRDMNEVYAWQKRIEGHVTDGPTRAAAAAWLKAITPETAESLEIPKVLDISEEGGTTAEAAEAPPVGGWKAVKGSAEASGPVGPNPAHVTGRMEIPQDAHSLAQVIRNSGLDWSDANHFTDEEWGDIAHEAGVEPVAGAQDFVPPTMRGLVRRALTEAPEAAPGRATEAAGEAEVRRVGSGKYEFDAVHESGQQATGTIERTRSKLTGTKWTLTMPDGSAEEFDSIDEAKAALRTMSTEAPPAAPAASAAPKTVKVGRAAAGRYGFEAMGPDGIIGQGKIVKEGNFWKVYHPGAEADELPEQFSSLKDAKAAATAKMQENTVAEEGRRAANRAKDIDPKDAYNAAQKAAQDWLENAPEGMLNTNPRFNQSTLDSRTPTEDWGHQIVKNMLADVTKARMADVSKLPVADAMHYDILNDIANKRVTPLDTLAAHPADARPLTLGGGAKALPTPKGNWVSNIVNAGHQKILSPMIDFMSREPMYVNLVKSEYDGGLKAAVDDGLLKDYEARRLAQERASFNMHKLVHNLNERTYLSEGMRNFAPFFFAETQSWRRMGQLLVDDPGAFRRFQLASSMVSNVGSVQQGSDGTSQLVFPGEGFLGTLAYKTLKGIGIPVAAAIPLAFTGTVQSLGPVFPLSHIADNPIPMGPAVSVGARALQMLAPELTPALTKVVGDAGMNQSIMDMLIPNSGLRGLYHTFTGDHNTAFMNTQLYVIQDLARQQEEENTTATREGRDPKVIVPGQDASPTAKQDFLHRINNQTRIIMGVRAVLADLNPTATSAAVGKTQLRDEVRQLMKEKGMTLGIQQFLSEHPDATPYTVFNSESNVNAPLSSGSDVGKWLDQNLDVVKNKYTYGGAWLIPQDKSNYSQGVYNEQLALSLRQRKAPDQFFKDIQVASSNNQYYALHKQYTDALTAAKGNSQQTAVVNRKWTAISASFNAMNPIWAEDFQSPDRKIVRQQTIADFRNMIAHPESVPASPMFDGIKELMQSYDAYVAASLPGRQDALATTARASATRKWEAYLDNLAQSSPELEPLILRIFKGASPTEATTAAKAQQYQGTVEQMLSQLTPDQLAGHTVP